MRLTWDGNEMWLLGLGLFLAGLIQMHLPPTATAMVGGAVAVSGLSMFNGER